MNKGLKDSPELNPDTNERGANTAVMLFVDFTRYFAYVFERKINFISFPNHHGKIFQLNTINLLDFLLRIYLLNSILDLVHTQSTSVFCTWQI